MDFALYWVDVGGKYVVSGAYCKQEIKDKQLDDRFDKACENVKLDAGALALGFVKNAQDNNSTGRQDIAKKFGIKTVIQEKVQGGILEYGSTKTLNARPDIPPLPEKELKVAYDDFGAVYTIVWIR